MALIVTIRAKHADTGATPQAAISTPCHQAARCRPVAAGERAGAGGGYLADDGFQSASDRTAPGPAYLSAQVPSTGGQQRRCGRNDFVHIARVRYLPGSN